MSELPEEVDCVILGTGLTNSILAASCARVGKSVLHLDEKSYYGDDWASFTFEQLLEWARIQQEVVEEENSSQTTFDELTFPMLKPKKDPIFSNVNVIIHKKLQAATDVSHLEEPVGVKRICKEENQNCFNDGDGGSSGKNDLEIANEEPVWTLDGLKEKSKLFCIDLNPKLIYSNGAMVELLVESNVARYHEFKNTVRLISMIDDNFQVLPCKRNEVFSSQIIPNLIDKRRLMKFLELCISLDEKNLEQSELKDCLSMDIEKCLLERNLGPNLRLLLMNSIAMVDPSTPTLTACKNIKKFLFSVERFGKSPFLFPMYGCGEFPQSFCRMCAVFGGVYCLNKQVETLSIIQMEDSQTQLSLKLDDGKKVKCKKLVLNYSHALTARIMISKTSTQQSRAILITTRSFYRNSDDHITLLRLPADSMSNKSPIFLLEVNASVMVCPIGLSIVYIWTPSCKNNATDDLLPIVKELYNKKNDDDSDSVREDPILWSCYFNKLVQHDETICNTKEEYGIMITSLGKSDTDYETIIKEASNTFHLMFPGEEFLPRAPDPDEIIFDGQDSGNLK